MRGMALWAQMNPEAAAIVPIVAGIVIVVMVVVMFVGGK